MPGWAKAALGWVIGGVSDLWNKVISLLTSVVGSIYQDIDSVWNQFVGYYNALIRFVDSIPTWVSNLINSVVAWTAHYIQDVENWVLGFLATISRDINSTITWVSNLINSVERWVAGLVNDVYQWVLKNVYDPIVKSISTVVSWINKYGATAYYLVTHPDALAQLVGRYLLDSYLDLMREYAGPVGRWMVHQMMKAADPIGSVIEDVISAIIE